VVKNKEKAVESLDALSRLMYKNTMEDLATLNLVQMLSQHIEKADDGRVTFNKSDMGIMLPIATLGGKYDMLLTISLNKVD